MKYTNSCQQKGAGDISNVMRGRKARRLAAGIVSGCLCLGILTCVICDLAITGGLTWSWFPTASAIYAFFLLLPPILWGRKGITAALGLLALLILPYLYALELIIGTPGLIMPVGVPVTLASLFCLWLAYIIIRRAPWPPYTRAAACLVLAIFLQFGINGILSLRMGEPLMDVWDVLSCAVLAAAALLAYGLGKLQNHKKEEQEGNV